MTTDAPTVRQQIATLIQAYEAELDFTVLLHPLNAAEQQQAFLAGDIEEPSFTYRPADLPAVSFPELDDGPLTELYQQRMAHTAGLAELLSAVGQDEQFAALSLGVFPVVDIPEAVLQPDKQTTNIATVDTNAIVQRFEEALQLAGLSDWSVTTRSDISSRMMVNQWTQTVTVRDGVLVTPEDLEGLVRHEIGAHVLRSARGRQQTEPLLHVATRRGRLGEEGVACYLENPAGHPRIFVRHHAVQFAATHTFRETWAELVGLGIDEQTSWTHTLRVKRGLQSGTSHGAFTKDCIYAQGLHEITAYLAAGGALAPLLSAPIHPADIPALQAETDFVIFDVPEYLTL